MHGGVTRLAIGRPTKRQLLTVLLLPLAGFFSAMWFIPIVYGFGASFFVDVIGDPTFVGLQNYVEILTGQEFWSALWRSSVYAVGTTVLSIVIGLGFALAVNQQLRWGSSLRAMMIFPYLIPTIVVVFIWKFLLSQNIGLVNIALVNVGVLREPIAFFSEVAWAMPAVILMSVWKYAPFAFFIFLAQLQAIDRTLYERARVEGASTWQAFRDITYPNIKTTIYLVVFIRGIWLFNTFDLIWVSTKGGPLSATTTLTIRIYRLLFSNFEFGMGAALGTILFFFLFVNAIVYFRVFDPEEVNV